MTPRKTDRETEAAYYIPGYELRDGAIQPVANRPVRPVSQEAFFPNPGASPEQQGFPLAVADFNGTDPRNPKAILAFANRYGILGAWLWSPFGQPRPPLDDQVAALRREVLAPCDGLRYLRECQEVPEPASHGNVRDAQAALALDPRHLTLSLWDAEPVTLWERAWFEFQSVIVLAASLQLLLLERHGAPETQEDLARDGAQFVQRMTESITPMLGRLDPSLDGAFREWFSDSPIPTRLSAGLGFIQHVWGTVSIASGQLVKPRPDLCGWESALNPPCVLNLLYLAFFASLVTLAHPFRICALPGCARLARANSQWCSDKHAATHRQRRHRAPPPVNPADPSERKSEARDAPAQAASPKVGEKPT